MNALKAKIPVLLSLAALGSPLAAQPQLALSYYLDDREFNTAALKVVVPRLAGGFSIWGFTDFHSRQQADDRYDLDTSFSEYRLSNSRPADWTGLPGVGAQIEYNDFSPGSDNSTWRAGLTYRHKVGDRGWLLWRAFPVQSRDAGQLSLSYGWSFSERWQFGGFADYNLRDDKPNQWVVEPELSVRLFSGLWALLEFRYNGFQDDNPALDGSGWALGLRYEF